MSKVRILTEAMVRTALRFHHMEFVDFEMEAREALAAADAIPDAPVEPRCTCWEAIEFGICTCGPPRPGVPMPAERRAELIEVMREGFRSSLGLARWERVLDALIAIGAVR